ncbi:hypothetical protein CBS101457_006613 [Exobasidium rhododendri]|nr:hypothetical protein CBS101457_006613 [Exobasidium rhododendri]
MASSLSQQLAQVRSYNSAQLGNAKSASKAQSASYLFPAHIASTQDHYTLQSLGANGWEELSQNDNTFLRWDQATGAGDLLFGESSRVLDRLMKSKEENEELDGAITQFLQLLGGNLLDRSSGKCIEWLVRRFRIHEYNVEAVLSTFLPYHETQEFARMLQLLNLDGKPHFSFLLPLQKRAVPLLPSILIATLLGPPSSTSSLSTLRWVVGLLSPKTITRFRRPNFALQTFWFSTMIKFCSRIQGLGDDTFRMGITKGKAKSKQNREDDYQQYLTILLPASIDAATTTQLGMDCQIGGCLVLCSIASCFQLSTAARKSLIASLADAKMDVLKVRKAYLTSIACLCMSQRGDDGGTISSQALFDASTTDKLSTKPHFLATISSLCQSYDMNDFVQQFTLALCQRVHDATVADNSSASKLLREFWQDSLITPDEIATTVAQESLILCSRDPNSIQSQENIRIIADIRQRRPEFLDDVVKRRMSGAIESEPLKRVLKHIVALQTGSTVSDISDEDVEEAFSTAPRPGKDTIDSLIQSTEETHAIEGSTTDLATEATPETSEMATYMSAIVASFRHPKESSQTLTKLFSQLGDTSLSFLASVWTNARNGAEIRLAALCHAQVYLCAFTTNDAKVRHVDFQTVLPSLLYALKDAESTIRLAALDCIGRISEAAKAIEGRSKSDSKVELYGFDSIYGHPHSERLKYLDTKDVLQFSSAIYKESASFEHNALYLHDWMSANVNPAKGEPRQTTAYKRRILECLFSHILCWPSYDAKLTLLDLLDGVYDASRLSTLLPLVEEVVKGDRNQDLDEDQFDAYVGLLMGAYDKTAKDAVEEDEGSCWSLYLEGLESGLPIVQKHVTITLQKSVFALLSEEKQRDVFARLANTIANATTPLPAELRSCLVSLDIRPHAIVPILSNLREIIASHALKSTQAKRVKRNSASTETVDDVWSKAMALLVEILEALHSRAALISSELLTELFECLRLGTELLLSNNSTGEYLMQISMSNLRASLQLLPASSRQGANSLDLLSSLRVDIVVNVIKTLCNPQTFQQALLLLSTLGGIAPDVVLHNAMPIFTFVGSTMLQRDDDYSFVVIERVLQSILPPVMKDMTAKVKGQGSLALLQSSSPLLCVFTDAAKHVPRHRRVSFFHSLVQVMGSDYLAPICMLLIDRYSSKISKQTDLVEIQMTLQLPLSLFAKSGSSGSRSDDAESSIHQWSALNGIWEECHRNWNHRKEDAVELQEHVFLDCVGSLSMEHKSLRLDPIKRVIALIRFIFLALVNHSDDMAEQQEQEEGDGDDGTEQTKSMWNFIEHALLMTQVDNEVINKIAQSTLEEMMKIAPINILFNVTLELLTSSKVGDNKNGLHLCSKSIAKMSDRDRERASKFTPKIIELCHELMRGEKDAWLMEPALETLLSIAQDCSASEHSALSLGLPQLITLARQKIKTQQVLELLIVYSKHLGTRMIPQLASIVSMGFDLLSDEETINSVRGATLTLFTSLVRSIPVFAASHVSSIIKLYIQHPLLAQELGQSSTLLSAIVRYIPPSQLFTTIYTTWEQGDKASLPLHTICLDLMERTIKMADKKSIMSSYKSIFKYLATLFDARRFTIIDTAHWKLSTADLIIVEDKAVSVFLKLVLKLNESTFRPLFLRICDWAMLDLASEEDENDDGEEAGAGRTGQEIVARKIVLFKVMNALLAQLGELVTNYYLNVLDGAVDILQDSAASRLESEELWKQVLLSLKQSANADKGRGSFWNENHIKAIASTLVDQAGSPYVKASPSSEALLGDTIAALCQTVPDENCLKQFNNQLLEKTRSSQIKVKISSIRILEKIWKSKECEDTLLGLVPETVPSIAELLQDSEVLVQEELSSFIAAVEAVLGEGLEGYLQ